ncbi:hypothetical protein TNCV_2748291 [Trichonephila clavipes]|nr:hypothetical protein TNCV_2748291 [Trichonephila clavipes]
MSKIRKIAGLDYLIVLSEEFITVDDVCTAPNYSRLRHFGVRSKIKKNIIDADSDDENGINYAALVPTLSEMRNVMKSMRSYLDAHSNGEMNNKMDDIEQFVDNFVSNLHQKFLSHRLAS